MTPISPAPASTPPWRLFVIQHSHIDIGFTDRQEVIAGYHRQFLEQAVEMALSPDQAGRDPAVRFKFTCESFWAVEQFLQTAGPDDRERLVRALRDGTVELSASYLHFTELLDAGHLRDSLRPARAFADRHGIPLRAAMSCDINGLPWGMADALAEVGVRYLCTNINPHHGGFPFERPLVPFHWRSPQGREILVWSGLPYHKANLLGLMGGYTPDQNPGIPGVLTQGTGGVVDVQDLTLAERQVFATVHGLAGSGYPYRFLPVMGSGLYTDNSPPTDRYCALLAEWNARHGSEVFIQTATLEEFFLYLEANVPDIPVYAGDWPDWWSDGVASVPAETKILRHTQRTKRLIERLDPGYDADSLARRAAMAQSLAVAAEHTFGHSHTDSAALLTQQVFKRKTSLMVEADVLIGRAWEEVRRALGEGDFTARRPFTYTVVNPAPEARTGVAYLPVDSWEQPVLEGLSVRDQDGREYAHQAEPAPRGWLIAVVLTLAGGERTTLRLEPGLSSPPASTGDISGTADTGAFENAFYRLLWARPRGLCSLVERTTGREVLDADVPVGMGGPIYQVFPGGDRLGPAGFLMAPRTIPRDEISVGRCTAVRTLQHGPVFSEIALDYEVPGATHYRVLARLFHALPSIGLSVQMHKTDVADPEGMYAAFPLSVPEGVWNLDRPGGPMRPGLDQLPGTCCDYYLVQEGAALIGPDLSVILATPDVPLVHIGGLNLWKYSTRREPTGFLYSWMTNNKWETNFSRYCGGLHEFAYTLEVRPGTMPSGDLPRECSRLNVPLVVCRH